ncbi:TAF8 Transcription initiation factor TFIID subunit 8 [Candida maltosa Xu316]
MDIILQQTIGAIVESKGCGYSQQFLDQLTELTLQFIHDLSTDLASYTRIQRRHQPSLSDTKLLLKLNNIHPSDLIDEIESSKKFPYRKELAETLKKSKDRKEEEEPLKDESRPFFEKSAITELVPRMNVKPNYIPSYLPDLPPDYTYQSTPEYMETLSDLKQLRVKLVEESRMTEQSLYKLIENDEVEWKQKFEEELEKLPQSLPSPKSPEPKQEIEQPKQENSKFDIVEYAQKRKKMLERREEKKRNKYKAREDNVFMQAETYYSPYATKTATPEVNQYFKDIISNGFKEVIASVRMAEKVKKEKIKQLEEEQARREQESQQHQNEIAFSFPTLNQLHSDSESESEDEVKQDQELNFDVAEDGEHKSLIVVENEKEDQNNNNETENLQAEEVSDISSEDEDMETIVA